jgi:hypothetical protein
MRPALIRISLCTRGSLVIRVARPPRRRHTEGNRTSTRTVRRGRATARKRTRSREWVGARGGRCRGAAAPISCRLTGGRQEPEVRAFRADHRYSPYLDLAGMSMPLRGRGVLLCLAEQVVDVLCGCQMDESRSHGGLLDRKRERGRGDRYLRAAPVRTSRGAPGAAGGVRARRGSSRSAHPPGARRGPPRCGLSPRDGGGGARRGTEASPCGQAPGDQDRRPPLSPQPLPRAWRRTGPRPSSRRTGSFR